jgi:hypothetical protein
VCENEEAEMTEPSTSSQPIPASAQPVPPPAQSGSIFSEFWLFLKEEKKWWLLPLVVVLLGLSAVIVFAEGSAIAPFIYSIF